MYDPCALVIVEVELPVSTFFNVIGTPVTTAAVGSVTTPAMSPVVAVCPKRLATAVIINTTNNAIGANKNTADHVCGPSPFMLMLQCAYDFVPAVTVDAMSTRWDTG